MGCWSLRGVPAKRLTLAGYPTQLSYLSSLFGWYINLPEALFHGQQAAGASLSHCDIVDYMC